MDASEFTRALRASKEASRDLAKITSAKRSNLIRDIGARLRGAEDQILAANRRDVDRLSDASRADRLILNTKRILDMAEAAQRVAAMPDSVGVVLSEYTIEPGLLLQRIAVPMGLVGVIYESRPNVTFDATILCLKSGNAVTLRGGSEARETNAVIVGVVRSALHAQGLNDDAVWLMPPDRELVHHLLTAVGLVDVVIPRGSAELIAFVRDTATVPTIETGAGVCHTYVSSTANLSAAAAIVLNAKVQRPTVCNALDTIIIDREVVKDFLSLLRSGLEENDVEVHADAASYAVLHDLGYGHLREATASDFGREFLSLACSIKTVDGLEEALCHIRDYSSRHSEAIISDDPALCDRFLAEVDAAVVMTNASTRFTDGEQFGLGAEMGISTQKLHARGPFGFEKLVTEKWIIRGDGNVRS